MSEIIILPVAFYGCETWSLRLREKRKLKVCENRVLRRLFQCKTEEVAGGWRRLHNKKLYNLYASPNIIMAIKLRRMRWAGHIAHMGEMRNAYKIFVGKSEGEGLGIGVTIILEWILGK
jgi:hypothetical protein